jgi:hypothetical protein
MAFSLSFISSYPVVSARICMLYSACVGSFATFFVGDEEGGGVVMLRRLEERMLESWDGASDSVRVRDEAAILETCG